MSEPANEQWAEKSARLKAKIEISKSGYGGVNKDGQIVDRRTDPTATPIPANPMFGTPEPKQL